MVVKSGVVDDDDDVVLRVSVICNKWMVGWLFGIGGQCRG